MKLSKYLFILSVVIMVLFCTSCKEDAPIEESPTDNIVVYDNLAFVYGRYGVAKYSYSDDRRLLEIVYNDLDTMSPYIVDGDEYVVTYSYGDNNVLTEIDYYGKKLAVTEHTSSGKALKACGEFNGSLYEAVLTYGANGVMTKEEYYVDGVLSELNSYDHKGLLVSSEFKDIGVITYDYADGEIYTNVDHKDSEDEMSEIVLYIAENNYPYAFMQSYEGIMVGYMWTYDANMLCTNTVIETVYDTSKYTEEYIMFYGDKNEVSSVWHYVYDTEAPVLLSKSQFNYDADLKFVSEIETSYNTEGGIEKVCSRSYPAESSEKIITDRYTDGAISSKDVVLTTYNNNGKAVNIVSDYYTADGKFDRATEEKYEYYDNGKILKRTSYVYEEKDILSHFLSEEYVYNESSEISKAIYTAYDKNGDMIEREVDEFEYDDQGNVTLQSISMYDSSDSFTGKEVTQKEYDEEGNLIKTTISAYDSEGQLIK